MLFSLFFFFFWIFCTIAGFHCHGTKKINAKLSSQKIKNITGCRKVLDILLVQVSGLYGIPYKPETWVCTEYRTICVEHFKMFHTEGDQHGGRKLMKTLEISMR